MPCTELIDAQAANDSKPRNRLQPLAARARCARAEGRHRGLTLHSLVLARPKAEALQGKTGEALCGEGAGGDPLGGGSRQVW